MLWGLCWAWRAVDAASPCLGSAPAGVFPGRPPPLTRVPPSQVRSRSWWTVLALPRWSLAALWSAWSWTDPDLSASSARAQISSSETSSSTTVLCRCLSETRLPCLPVVLSLVRASLAQTASPLLAARRLLVCLYSKSLLSHRFSCGALTGCPDAVK